MAHELELKPIRLYSTATPNGYKVSIFLEELKTFYSGFKYEVRVVSFRNNEQKEPWYLEVNPNGRLPAITDPNRGDFNVFETAAIILYLAQHYDTKHKLSFDPNDADAFSEALQWTFFIHGGVGPMQAQAHHFNGISTSNEARTYGINRYQGEVRRLYNVLESRLGSGREYLAGPGKGRYSFADINGFPWVRSYAMAGIENFEENFPNVKAWLDRIEARPSVQDGLGVPARDNADCVDAPFAS